MPDDPNPNPNPNPHPHPNPNPNPHPNPSPSPNPKPSPSPSPTPNKVVRAPIIPTIKSPLDTSNYEHYDDDDGMDWARYHDKSKDVFSAF